MAEQPTSDVGMDDFMASFSIRDQGLKNNFKSTAISAAASSSSISSSSLRKVGAGSGGSSFPSAYSSSTPTMSQGGPFLSPSGQVNPLFPMNYSAQSQSHYTAPQQIVQQSNLQPTLQGPQMYSSLQSQTPGMGFDRGPAHGSSVQFPPQGIYSGIGNSSTGGMVGSGTDGEFSNQKQQQQQQQYQQNQTVGNRLIMQQPLPLSSSSSFSNVQYPAQYLNGPNTFQQAINPYPNNNVYQNPIAGSTTTGYGNNMANDKNSNSNSVNKDLDPFSFLD